MRAVRRIVIGIVALLVVLVVGIVIVSQTAAFRQWLRREVVTRLNTGLNGVVTVGGLEGNLVQRLVLTNVRLTSESRRILAARRVVARYDLVQLVLGHGLVLRDVDIDGLALAVVEDEQGWNAARLYPPAPQPAQPSTLVVTLANARIADGSVKVVRRADVWRLRDLRLAGSGRFGPDGQSLAVSALSAALPGRDVTIAELTGKLAVDRDGSIRADALHLRTGGSELRADARTPGTAGGDYDVTVDVPRLAAEEVRHLLRVRSPAADLAANVRLRGPMEWAALDASMTSTAGSVALTGHVGRSDVPSYDVRATLTALDAAALLGPAQPVTNLSGTIDAKGRGATLADAYASAAIELHDSMVSGRALPRVSLSAGVGAQQLGFTAAATLERGEAQAAGTVGVADERYDVHLTTRDFDPAPLLARTDVRSRLNLTLAVTGSGFRPATARGEAHLAMTPSSIEQVPTQSSGQIPGAVQVANAIVDVRAAGGTLTIDRLHVDANALQLDAGGTLSLAVPSSTDERAPPPRGEVRYTLRAPDLAPVGRLAGAGSLSGNVAIEGSASGAVGDLGVRATVAGRELARADTQIGTLTASISGDGIGGARGRADVTAHADNLHAVGRHLTSLDVQAHWQQDALARASAHASVAAQEDERRRHELVVDAALEPSERRIRIAGLRLDLGDDTWRAEGTPLIVLRGERVALHDLNLRSARGVVRAAGEGGTTGAEDLTLQVEGLDVTALAPSMKDDVTGRVSATAHVGGSAQAPAIEAHAAIEQPMIERVQYERVAVDARIGGGRAAVNATVVQAGPRQLTLEVASPLRLSLSPFQYDAAGTLAGALRAQTIDLAFLDPLLPQVSKLAGTLNADLALGGTVASPEARGPIEIVGGRAYVVPIGLTYDPIELRMTLAGPAAEIDTLRVVSGKGTLSGGGSARVAAEGATIDTRIQLDHFPLFKNEYGEGAASGWVWVSGTTAAPVVDGALTTDRFVLLIPESLPGAVRPPDPTITVVSSSAGAPAPTLQPTAATGPPEAAKAPTPGIYDRAAITVQVDVPHDAWIRRSDTNVELRGWMTAWKKPAQDLVLAGEINTVRGWYTFQGKTFTIEEGRVTFTGQDMNPLLELTAAHKAGDYTVRVKVGGTLTKPTLTLESEPWLEQADVLSVLLFGKPASQLNSGESAGLREQAIGVASSYAASELTRSVANTLGLDTLQFQSGGQGVQGSSITLGKYVAPDVFVSLAHRFARQGVEEIRIEYTVTPHWSVETSSDTLGDSGLDVFWKNRY